MTDCIYFDMYMENASWHYIIKIKAILIPTISDETIIFQAITVIQRAYVQNNVNSE